MSEEQAALLAGTLHQTTLKFVQQTLAPQLDEARRAAERIDQITGYGAHTPGSAMKEITALDHELDRLPPAIAAEAYNPTPNPSGRVVPDSTLKAMHAALKQADKWTSWGGDHPKTDQVRAAGQVLYGSLVKLDAALGPDTVNQNIVDPSLTSTLAT